MKKVCRLDGLGCASCAAKIENAVAKLEGVSSASVNFMTTKMVIEGEDARMDEIMEQATAIEKKLLSMMVTSLSFSFLGRWSISFSPVNSRRLSTSSVR